VRCRARGFQLAKQLRQAPRKNSAELVEEIGAIPGVAAMEIAETGYINIPLNLGEFGGALLRGETRDSERSPRRSCRTHEHQSE